MIIGFDIDETLTDSYKVIKKYARKYDKQYSNNRYISNKVDDIMVNYTDEIITKFFVDHSFEMGNEMKVKKDAKKVIDKLHDEGFKIYFITSRNDKFYRDAQLFCESYLNKNNIYYDKLITGPQIKIDTCIEEKIDIMVDDSIYTCEELDKRGIKSILFASRANKGKQTYIKRVYNWKELYDYIHEYVKKIQT